MEEYLDSARDVERQVQKLGTQDFSSVDIPDAPLGVPGNWEQHINLMFDLGQAATDLAFAMEGDIEENLSKVMVALGEMSRAGLFANAARHGEYSPEGRFYTKVMNLASSNLDVVSTTYYSITVQDMTRLAAALREGSNILNGARSNAITRPL